MDVAADKVRAQIEAILLSWGMEADLAANTTEAMTETNLFGVNSHGIAFWRVSMFSTLLTPAHSHF